MRKKLLTIFCVISLLTTLLVWFSPKVEISKEERRKLNQFPKLSAKTVIDGSFMEKFEEYAKDQFPFRFKTRQAKAFIHYYGLQIFENNNFYLEDDKAIKIDYPLKESSVLKVSKIIKAIVDEYDLDGNMYYSLVPDKVSYSKDETIPKVNFSEFEEIMANELVGIPYISIFNELSLDDYYNSDIHWKSENLEKVAEKILSSMDKDSSLNFEVNNISDYFEGVYYGHSALMIKPDTIKSISNDAINNAKVSLFDKSDDFTVYDISKINERDPYDYYLYGAEPLVTINNDLANSDDELIIFRDSFASSLTPYFIEKYKSITLIDVRYIPHLKLAEYVDFENKDVLFMFNTQILNNSGSMR